MAFMDMIDNLAEKCGLNRGDRMQYGLVLLVALVIVFSAITLIWTFTGGPSGGDRPEPIQQRYYDLETKQEMTADQFNFADDQARQDWEMTATMDPYQGYIPNPNTGRATLVLMVKCPACKEWYAPEAYIQRNPEMPVVCTNPEGKTDLNEWYREQRRKRK